MEFIFTDFAEVVSIFMYGVFVIVGVIVLWNIDIFIRAYMKMNLLYFVNPRKFREISSSHNRQFVSNRM